jgi:hypothetical protein
MANLFEPDFDAEQDEPPFTWRRARLGRQAGAEALGASLFELPPGASSFPLHVHHANAPSMASASWRLVSWSRARPAVAARTGSTTAATSRRASSWSAR